MDLADVPRHRPLAFDKMESLIKEMQDPVTGVPVRSQKLFLSIIPSAFSGYDLVEWLYDRFHLEEGTNVEALNIGNQLCQHGYFFPVNDLKNLVFKDDSALYRFQSPYYWPWQGPRLAGSGSSAPTLGPDNVEYAIYLVKRTLRNKQRHGLEDYEQEALNNLKKNLAAKWDFITMQAEEQVRLAKERKKDRKIVSDSQERAYWRVARPPPGVTSALEPCPVPVRVRHPRPKKKTIYQINREIEHLKACLDRTRVKTSIALEALLAYSETFAPYDAWVTPPQPSNPWISDDTFFWQINSPIVEVPSEKRVQRWALSIEELISDPTGLQEFTSFLRKEYSHENIRFWLAVMDLRRSGVKQIPKKLESIYEEFLKPGAPCEINIDGATAERVAEGIRSGSRYALDHAADHVYGLLLKKDCYPRFVRSDHFQRLLAEGRNVLQKKAKFFNFGGQVKKKTGSTGGSGLTRRRGSDRSLTGSAHELAVCAAQPPRAPDPPPHSHSQSNLCDIPRDPLDDDSADALPWENSSRESSYASARRRQDSVADSGSSSSDVSAAIAVGERRRLPQQSTLDGGLRGAPPPLRRLSAIEPRHLAPLASPPHSPRQPRGSTAPPAPQPAPHHPTPTISVSSAPDEESRASSPDDRRSFVQSDEPSSVFASADATPTEPARCGLMCTSDNEARTDSNVEVTVVSVPSVSAPVDSPCLPDSKHGSIEDVKDLKANEKVVEEGHVSGVSDEESVSARASSLESSLKYEVNRIPSKDAEDASDEQPMVFCAPEGAASEVEPDVATLEPTTSTDAVEPVREMITRVPEKGSELVACVTAPQFAGDMVAHATVAQSASKMVAHATAAQSTCEMVAHATEAQPASEMVAHVTGAQPAGEMAARNAAPQLAGETVARATAPLAVCEDICVDDEHVDKVSSVPPQRLLRDSKAASETDATKKIAHRDELSSVSESDIVKRDSKAVSELKQRNDICPWEDENSCESDAPFVKTYATLGYL